MGKRASLLGGVCLLAAVAFLVSGSPDAVVARTSGGFTFVSDQTACPPEEISTPVIVCGEIPSDYNLPRLPAVLPSDGRVFVLYPSINPDEGGVCPIPTEPSSVIASTICGPVSGRIPFVPFANSALCGQAEARLQAMKASYAKQAPDRLVQRAFPALDPTSCLIYPATDGERGVAHFQALDPEAVVMPIDVGMVG